MEFFSFKEIGFLRAREFTAQDEAESEFWFFFLLGEDNRYVSLRERVITDSPSARTGIRFFLCDLFSHFELARSTNLKDSFVRRSRARVPQIFVNSFSNLQL